MPEIRDLEVRLDETSPGTALLSITYTLRVRPWEFGTWVDESAQIRTGPPSDRGSSRGKKLLVIGPKTPHQLPDGKQKTGEGLEAHALELREISHTVELDDGLADTTLLERVLKTLDAPKGQTGLHLRLKVSAHRPDPHQASTAIGP